MSAFIELLTVEFHLPGCSSLKEKRSRLSGLKDKFGKSANLAISETGFHDIHQKAQWSVVGLANTQKKLDQLFAKVDIHIATQVDAVIISMEKQRV